MRQSLIGIAVIGLAAAIAPRAWADDGQCSPGTSALLNEGFARQQAGDFAGAVPYFEEAAAQIPAAKALAANALFHAGQVNEAWSMAQEAVSAAPDIAATHVIDSLIAYRTGHGDEGYDEALRGLALAPSWPDAISAMGSAYYLRGDFARARVQEESLLQNSQDAQGTSIALANLAELDELGGDNTAAESKLNEALQANPDGDWPYYELGFLYEITGRSDAAGMMVKQAVSIDRNAVDITYNSYFIWPELRLARTALAAEARGDINGAIALWTQVAQLEAHGQLQFEPLRGHAAAHLAKLTRAASVTQPFKTRDINAVTAAIPDEVARVDEVAKPEEEPAHLFW